MKAHSSSTSAKCLWNGGRRWEQKYSYILGIRRSELIHPAAVIIAYTTFAGRPSFSAEDPAAFMIAGTNDWIVPAEHMPARAAKMRKAGIPAECTILPGVEHGFGTGKGIHQAMRASEDSMNKLGVESLDLYLIHWPAVARWHDDWRKINRSSWKAFEELYRDGRIKAIGVSNFLAHHIKALIEDGDIKPMVNQIEYHPGFGQLESAEYCRRNGIVVEAWSPLGSGDVLKDGHKTCRSMILKYRIAI